MIAGDVTQSKAKPTQKHKDQRRREEEKHTFNSSRQEAQQDEMFPYVVAALACLLFFSNPLLEYIYGPDYQQQQQQQQKRIIPRTPRPRLNESLLAMDDGAELSCPPDAYVVHVFSKAPLVLYVENFLSEEERTHLLEIRYVCVCVCVCFLLVLDDGLC